MTESQDSVLSGSEMDTENKLLCGPCDEDGQKKAAAGYCVDCSEYLCDTCYSHHRTPRPCRDHVLQDSTQMPRARKPTNENSTHFKCTIHLNEEITHFCQTHKQLCCAACIPFTHGVCKDVQIIREVSSNITKKDEYKLFKSKLAEFQEKYTKGGEIATKNIDLAEKCFASAMESFQNKLVEIRTNDISRMRSTIKTCDQVVKQITIWQSDIDKLTDEESEQLFVSMKIAESQFERLEENYSQMINIKAEIDAYRFLDCALESEKEIGKLVKTPFCLGKIPLAYSKEKSEFYIRDLCLVGQDALLVTDSLNDNVKLIDIKKKSILSKYICSSRQSRSSGPRNIAITDKLEAFVTCKNSTVIRFMSPSKDLRNYKVIATNGNCRAIEYHNDKLRVQCYNPCNQLELDKDGNYLRTISKDISEARDCDGKTFISHPMFSTMNKRTGAMIVSCAKNNSISEITAEGHVKLVILSETLGSPKGLEWLSDGSLLVCASRIRRVLRVTENGDVDDYLKEKLTFEPEAIHLERKKCLLYIAGKCDTVSVYQLAFV